MKERESISVPECVPTCIYLCMHVCRVCVCVVGLVSECMSERQRALLPSLFPTHPTHPYHSMNVSIHVSHHIHCECASVCIRMRMYVIPSSPGWLACRPHWTPILATAGLTQRSVVHYTHTWDTYIHASTDLCCVCRPCVFIDRIITNAT